MTERMMLLITCRRLSTTYKLYHGRLQDLTPEIQTYSKTTNTRRIQVNDAEQKSLLSQPARSSQHAFTFITERKAIMAYVCAKAQTGGKQL